MAVIAVDVHQTLMDDHGPSDSGPVMPGAREAMQAFKEAGHQLAIWTVGDTAGITRWLEDNGIPFDFVNESPLTPDDTDSGKIRADCYVDDKSVEFDGDWEATTEEVLAAMAAKDEKRAQWEAGQKSKMAPEGPYTSPYASIPAFLIQALINGQLTYVVVNQNQQPKDGTLVPSLQAGRAWLKDNGYVKKALKSLSIIAKRADPEHQQQLKAVRKAAAAKVKKFTFDAEDCPECGTPMEGDPYSGDCNHCGYHWGVETEEKTKGANVTYAKETRGQGINEETIHTATSNGAEVAKIIKRFIAGTRGSTVTFIARMSGEPSSMSREFDSLNDAKAYVLRQLESRGKSEDDDVEKGAGGRESEFMRWGGLVASAVGLATGNPIPALMAAGGVAYDWLVRRFNDGYTPEQMTAMFPKDRSKSIEGEEDKGLLQDAGKFLADKWVALEDRYGRKAALAMAVAGLATFPIPGNIAAVIGAAEAIRGIHGWATKNLDEGEMEEMGKTLEVKSIRKAIGKMIGDYDEETNSAEFVVSTSAPDRDGDTVDQDSLDWAEFDVNPVMTLTHDTDKIPVGKWLPETRRRAKVKDPSSGDEVEATVMRGQFNLHTEEGKSVAGSVKDGFLQAASVSFLPQDGGTEKNNSGGSNYVNAKVTETAVCAVPANQGATRAVEMVLKSWRSKSAYSASKSDNLAGYAKDVKVGDEIDNHGKVMRIERTQIGDRVFHTEKGGRVVYEQNDTVIIVRGKKSLGSNKGAIVKYWRSALTGKVKMLRKDVAKVCKAAEEGEVEQSKGKGQPCECSDPGCPACHGHCSKPSTTGLTRIDMGGGKIWMCDGCADDAYESGVFRSKAKNDHSEEAVATALKAATGEDIVEAELVDEEPIAGAEWQEEEVPMPVEESKDHGTYGIEQGTAADGPQAGKWFVTGPTGRRVAGPLSSEHAAMEEAGQMIARDRKGGKSKDHLQDSGAESKAAKFKVGDQVAWKIGDGNTMAGKVVYVGFSDYSIKRVDGGEVIVKESELKPASSADMQAAINFYKKSTDSGADEEKGFSRAVVYRGSEIPTDRVQGIDASKFYVIDLSSDKVLAGPFSSRQEANLAAYDQKQKADEPDADDVAQKAEELVEAGCDPDEAPAMAYKCLKRLARKTTKTYCVRVGKRWVRKAVLTQSEPKSSRAQAESDGKRLFPEGFYVVQTPLGYIAVSNNAKSKTELTDEADATAMSKDEAVELAEETGGEVEESKGHRWVNGVAVDDNGPGSQGYDDGAKGKPNRHLGSEYEAAYNQGRQAASGTGQAWGPGKSDPAPEAIASKAEELVEAGIEEDEAPAMAFKILRKAADREDYGNYTILQRGGTWTVYPRNQTAGRPTTDFDPHFASVTAAKQTIDSQGKSLSRSKAMDDFEESGPTGLKAIKGWIAKIEEDMAEMHKAEQGAVMDAGSKAIKLLKSCMAKAYGDDGVAKEVEEEGDEQSKAGNRYIVWNGEPGNGGKKIGEFSTMAEAQQAAKQWKQSHPNEDMGISVETVWKAKDGDELESEEQVVAGKRLKVFKSLSKTQKACVKDATEFLEDAAGAADTPKRLKSGMSHHAMQLKELIEERKQEQLVNEEEELSKDEAAELPLDEEGQSKLEELAKAMKAGVDRIESIDRKMFQVAGRQYRNGN